MPEALTRTHFNGHSMVGGLERVMVCSPRTAGWNRRECSKSMVVTPGATMERT
jgi:hypothetical protein